MTMTMTANDIENMKKIVESIQSMDKFDQMEILKILVSNSCKINENKSGVFVNLTLLPQNVLDEMCEYIRYIKFKQDSIDTFETKKTEYKNTFFIQTNKDEFTNKVYSTP